MESSPLRPTGRVNKLKPCTVRVRVPQWAPNKIEDKIMTIEEKVQEYHDSLDAIPYDDIVAFRIFTEGTEEFGLDKWLDVTVHNLAIIKRK